jgi:hypothetical protein
MIIVGAVESISDSYSLSSLSIFNMFFRLIGLWLYFSVSSGGLADDVACMVLNISF